MSQSLTFSERGRRKKGNTVIPFISSTKPSYCFKTAVILSGRSDCMGVQGGRDSGGLAMFCFLSWVLKNTFNPSSAFIPVQRGGASKQQLSNGHSGSGSP